MMSEDAAGGQRDDSVMTYTALIEQLVSERSG
jgi:hypothetical protein